MGHWNDWDAVNCLKQFTLTQPWYEKLNTGQANFNSNRDPTHVVVIILEPTAQSQPPPTII
eukprot:scaffold61758_cov43-Cyclotella_meneghiniana.AAC.1